MVDRNIFYDKFYIAKRKMKNKKHTKEIKDIFSFIDNNIQNLLAEK